MLAEKLPVMSDDTDTVKVKFLAEPIPARKLRLIKKDSEAAKAVLQQLQTVIASTEVQYPNVTAKRRAIFI